MERQQSIAPGKAPEVGESTDVEAALTAERGSVPAVPDRAGEPDPEGGPPDGTAGVSAGGAG